MSCGAIVASTSCTAKAVFDPTAPAAEPVSYQLDNLILASSVMLLIAPPIYSASSLRPDHVKIKTLVYSGAGFLFALGLASSCETPIFCINLVCTCLLLTAKPSLDLLRMLSRSCKQMLQA